MKSDGFHIFVNAEKKAAETYNTWLQNPYLEGNLPGRIRFTIAHEIAHTFFYSVGPRSPVDLFEPETPYEVEHLEQLCNQIASELLLPQQLVRRVALSMDFLEPDSLRSFSRKVGASVEAIVIKAQRNADWLHDAGAILAVEKSSAGWTVKATALGCLIHLRNTLRKGNSVSEIIKSPSFCLNGGNAPRITTFLTFETDFGTGFQRVEACCEREAATQTSAVLTLRARNEPLVI